MASNFCQQLSLVVISVLAAAAALSKDARKIFNEVIDDSESDVSKVGNRRRFVEYCRLLFSSTLTQVLYPDYLTTL